MADNRPQIVGGDDQAKTQPMAGDSKESSPAMAADSPETRHPSADDSKESPQPTAIPDKQEDIAQAHVDDFSGLDLQSFDRPSLHPEENDRWCDGRNFGGVADFLEGRWGSLEFEIGKFVTHCLPARISWDSLSSDTQDKIKVWAPKAKEYIEDEMFGCARLIEAWVWRILYDNLLSPDCADKWCGEHWADYGKLRRTLQGMLILKSFTSIFNC